MISSLLVSLCGEQWINDLQGSSRQIAGNLSLDRLQLLKHNLKMTKRIKWCRISPVTSQHQFIRKAFIFWCLIKVFPDMWQAVLFHRSYNHVSLLTMDLSLNINVKSSHVNNLKMKHHFFLFLNMSVTPLCITTCNLNFWFWFHFTVSNNLFDFLGISRTLGSASELPLSRTLQRILNSQWQSDAGVWRQKGLKFKSRILCVSEKRRWMQCWMMIRTFVSLCPSLLTPIFLLDPQLIECYI